MLFTILDLRLYAKARESYLEGLQEPDMKKRPHGGAIEQVREFAFEIAKEKIKRARESDV